MPKCPDRRIPLGLRDELVTTGDHIAYFWNTPTEFREAVGFLDVGLERGDFCVIFGHAKGNRRVCEVLAERGYDCAGLQNQGRLAIVDGQTTAATLLSTIGHVFTDALAQGATLIRLLGNIGWGYHGWPDETDLLEFEAKVTSAARQFPCVVVCMYDVGTASGRVILHGAFETHPLTFFRNLMRKNNQYVMHHHNHELRAALEELGRRHAELQDTNRGVVALYAELDEKAEHLQRTDAMKSRFLSNVSHEFQTPLNAILALTRMLIEHTDGDLEPEQEKQVRFIRDAAEQLSELVSDLLDIAKVEAGKVTIRPASFTVAELFGALRGLIRPLQQREAVSLVFESADGLPRLFTDEGKVSQVLRNYISNALKFTEAGEVRVSASVDVDGMVVFHVRDTGIGIAQEDQHRLFQEFGQVPNRLQSRVRGTGLGLSLSKRLAELLGGSVGVTSVPGEGSTFWLRIPETLPGHQPAPQEPSAPPPAIPDAPLALVVDDEQTARYVLRR